MDAVQIEQKFGDIWEAETRFHEADADRVRSGEPKQLAKALEKACNVLTKRIEGLPSGDPLHFWIEDALESARARAKVLKTEKLQEMKEATKTGKILNHAHPLWEAYADLLHLIHIYLKSKEL